MMKKTLFGSLMVMAMMLLIACGNDKQNDTVKQPPVQQQEVESPAQPVVVNENAPHDKNSEFIVVSKKDLRLTVYARSGNDTVALATYPVCMGKNKGQKQGKGDMRTPESPADKPFSITRIQDASTWKHDFGDGRGSILAYGHWFLRLDTPGHSGIGIHGSTNNENTVPGRASEGCVRLLDKDIIQLKEKYAREGMPVIIKAEDQGPLPFE